jgi:hypothetical protein
MLMRQSSLRLLVAVSLALLANPVAGQSEIQNRLGTCDLPQQIVEYTAIAAPAALHPTRWLERDAADDVPICDSSVLGRRLPGWTLSQSVSISFPRLQNLLLITLRTAASL